MKDDISIRTTGTETDENVQPDVLQDGLQPEEVQPGENLSGGQSSSPRRYRLYDKFADHVSVRTLDMVILITAVLIIGLLIYGIVTGSPQ